MDSLEEELNQYSEYWRAKILRNVERDNENNKQLFALGWTVVRIWESEIKKNVNVCVSIIEKALLDKSSINT